MSILEKLGADYRFTEKDFTLAWQLFVKSPDISEEEQEFSYIALLGDTLHSKNGAYPTLGESLAEHVRRENAYQTTYFKQPRHEAQQS
jgi:hypothetical protein